MPLRRSLAVLLLALPACSDAPTAPRVPIDLVAFDVARPGGLSADATVELVEGAAPNRLRVRVSVAFTAPEDAPGDVELMGTGCFVRLLAWRDAGRSELVWDQFSEEQVCLDALWPVVVPPGESVVVETVKDVSPIVAARLLQGGPAHVVAVLDQADGPFLGVEARWVVGSR